MPSDWQRALCAEFGEDAAAVCAQLDELRGTLPDPARAEEDLAAFLAAQGRTPAALRQLRADPLALDLLLRLGGCSRYGFDLARQFPGFFWDIVQERSFRQVWGRRTMAAALAEQFATLSTRAARLNAVGLFKHRHWLRIILGDLAGDLSLHAVVGELSDCTDVLVQAALGLALARLGERYGIPLPADHPSFPGFAVLGLGKLGGRELNYSSDIDLVFVYELPEGEVGGIDAHDWARRLGSEAIRILEEPGDGGPMFRVDMRLRPEGERGELALSRRETLDYYFSVGRPWERQALIKARCIAGSQALGDGLLTELRPWIYPADPAWEDIDDARAMRRRIEERADAADVKTGAGGIRDIEFLVQHFQLALGGRDGELRRRDTLPTLFLLADRGLLPRRDAEILAGHYAWLRLVEHRLQIWENRQEHAVPAEPAERGRLARRCGLAGREAFDTRLAAVRAAVRRLTARHFLAGSRDADGHLALLVQGEADAELAQRILAPVGFRDPAAAAANLRSLAAEPFFVLSRARTERALAGLLPLLLHLLGESPDPDLTLANLARLVAAAGGRAVFFDLLAARADLLALLVDIAGWSNYLVDALTAFPGMLDELCDALSRRPSPRSALLPEARQLVQGLSHPGEPLAWLVARERCLAAVRDLQGGDAGDAAVRQGAVAEAVLQVVLQHHAGERARQWGLPLDGGRPVRFAILALGKLGGGELGYLSDMDVLFVCDPGGACPRAERDGLAFWTRVAQDLMATMQEGRLYELDPRLRPWGEQGELVVDTATLDGYWTAGRELWERLAMVRARCVAGDPHLGADAVALLRRHAVAAPPPADAAEQVRAMRRRLEDSAAGRDHLKRGPGGYVDVEFIAQQRCLGLPADELPDPPGTAALLRRLAALGRLEAGAAAELAEDLAFLRFVESRHRLATGTAVSHIPAEAAPRTALARRCRFADLAAFDRRLRQARERNRAWFDRLVG